MNFHHFQVGHFIDRKVPVQGLVTYQPCFELVQKAF